MLQRTLHLGLVAVGLVSVLASGCKPKEVPQGLVADAAITLAITDAGASTTTTDTSQCLGCQLASAPSWTFEGIYRDDHCTDPLAQADLPACAAVPALGPTSITYVDEIQARKAGTSAQVTLTEQIPPTAVRYRKAGTACVRANETATDVTPLACNGSKVCRDANGGLVCSGCRNLGSGCPDYQETRMYSALTDPDIKANKPGGGGGGLGNLKQCCAALANEAKRQGNSPELVAAATQCNALVAAAGPSGNAPELASLKALLAGRNVPAVCAGL
jgi:hypothetical protein